MQKMNELADAIQKASDILLITHVNPDGDAIGSTLALRNILKNIGKNVVSVCDGKVVEKYAYLERAGELELPENHERDFELAISIDCADKNRMGNAEKIFFRAGKNINIDHHNTNDCFADLNYVKNVSSSGELIYEVIEALGCGFDEITSQCLYTAITSDTGNFTYSNTTQKAMEYAAKLINHFDFVKTAELLYRTRTFKNTRLIARAIDNMTLHDDERIALMVMHQSDLEEIGIKLPDYEMLINYASEIETVKIALFLRELKDGGCKISFRSKGELDVARLASNYSGGGHKNASGGMVNVSLEEAKEAVLKDAMRLLRE